MENTYCRCARTQSKVHLHHVLHTGGGVLLGVGCVHCVSPYCTFRTVYGAPGAQVQRYTCIARAVRVAPYTLVFNAD